MNRLMTPMFMGQKEITAEGLSGNEGRNKESPRSSPSFTNIFTRFLAEKSLREPLGSLDQSEKRFADRPAWVERNEWVAGRPAAELSDESLLSLWEALYPFLVNEDVTTAQSAESEGRTKTSKRSVSAAEWSEGEEWANASTLSASDLLTALAVRLAEQFFPELPEPLDQYGEKSMDRPVWTEWSEWVAGQPAAELSDESLLSLWEALYPFLVAENVTTAESAENEGRTKASWLPVSAAEWSEGEGGVNASTLFASDLLTALAVRLAEQLFSQQLESADRRVENLMKRSEWVAERPALERLLERLAQDTVQQNGHDAGQTDEHGLARLHQALAAWFEQLPTQEQQSVIRQFIPFIEAAMKVKSPSLSVNLENGKSDESNPVSEQATQRSEVRAGEAFVPNRSVPTTSPQSGQTGANGLRSATGSMRISSFAQSSEQTAHTTQVETKAAGGELVETTSLRLESGTHAGSVSSAPNTPINATIARPGLWNASAFTESLHQTIVRHLQVDPNGVSQARLSLYPEHLGQVDVRITSQNGVLTAQLVTDTWFAKQLLEGQLDQLRQALQNQGLQVNKLAVSIGEQGLMSRHPHHRHGNEWDGSLEQAQTPSPLNAQERYANSETSQIERWRNPHASVNYTA